MRLALAIKIVSASTIDLIYFSHLTSLLVVESPRDRDIISSLRTFPKIRFLKLVAVEYEDLYQRMASS